MCAVGRHYYPSIHSQGSDVCGFREMIRERFEFFEPVSF